MTPPATTIDRLQSRTDWRHARLFAAAKQIRSFREQDARNGIEWETGK